METIEVWWRWDPDFARYILAWYEGSVIPRPSTCYATSVTKNQWVWRGYWDHVAKRYYGGGFICAPVDADPGWE